MSSGRPRIAITVDQEQHPVRGPMYYIRRSYVAAILRAGGLPILVPACLDGLDDRGIAALAAEILANVEGIVVTGGGDLPPSAYGCKPHPKLGSVIEERSRLELELCRQAVNADRPYLGICAGMQVLNVAMGGTLWQDLPSEKPGPIQHGGNSSLDLVHRVHLRGDSRLRSILGMDDLEVNSTHHQAAREVPAIFKIAAEAPDGVVEAIEAPAKRFVIGVQWHPEQITGKAPEEERLFAAFLQAAQR